jgi:succinate dehydrogenase/fumarate reductase flavoprotein subunit
MSGKYSFETPQEPIREEQIVDTIETGVAVVGAGLSGLVAALRAAELGADVTVLEKTKSFNARGGHFGAANAKPWREIGEINDRKALARAWIAACGNRAREEQVWLFINNSEEAMDWFTEKQAKHDTHAKLNGARYKGPSYTEYIGSLSFVGPRFLNGEFSMPAQETAANLYEDGLAAGVKYLFNTPGKQLEKNGDRIVSVIGQSHKGYVRIKASKGVILATGDIHGDKEMLEAYCPMMLKVKHSQYNPAGANTGDGHKMGLWAGAVMEDAPLAAVIHPQGYSRMQAFFLFVNVKGNRFMNEDTWCQAKSLNVLRQPGHTDYAFAIFDSDWRAQMIKGMPYSGGLFNDNSASVYGQPFNGDFETKFIETGLKNGNVVCADTIDDLALRAKLPPGNLKRTVDRYNELVKAGDDRDYGKRNEVMFPIAKAPFYASKFGPAKLAVTGGLLVDTGLRVENEDMDPIPGLYAVGNVAGGLYGVDYPTIIPGNSHGRAITWGYLAARTAIEDSE